MAKRKSRQKHHRRRRVSGIGDSNALQMVLGAVAGSIAGNMLASKLTSLDDKIKGGALVLLPVLFGKNLKGPLLQGVGIGVGAAGGLLAAKSFGIVSGVPVVSGHYRRRVNGYGYPVVSGSADQPYLRTGAIRPSAQNVVSGVSYNEKIYAGGVMKDYNDGARG